MGCRPLPEAPHFPPPGGGAELWPLLAFPLLVLQNCPSDHGLIPTANKHTPPGTRRNAGQGLQSSRVGSRQHFTGAGGAAAVAVEF